MSGIQDKTERLYYKHRFAIFLFSYVVLYNFLIVNRGNLWSVTAITYSYHIVDYRFGFRPNILPGAIFNALFGNRATEKAASVYETVLILLFFVGLALFLEKFILNVDSLRRRAALVTIVLYLSGSFTFSAFTYELGMLDVYWLFFTLLFFIFVKKKIVRFFVPVLYALSLLVHFSSVLNCLILFSLVILYIISSEKDIKEKRIYITIFILSMIASIGLLSIMLISQSVNSGYSIDEYHAYFKERGSEYYLYYDYAFYNLYGDKEVVKQSVFSIESPILRIFYLIVGRNQFTLDLYKSDVVDTVIRVVLAASLLSPLLALIYKNIFVFIKTNTNRLSKFVSLMLMIQIPFTAIIGCSFSPDIVRWITHAFLTGFTLFLYLMYREEELRISVLNDIERFRGSLPAFVFCFAYFLVNLWPYS